MALGAGLNQSQEPRIPFRSHKLVQEPKNLGRLSLPSQAHSRELKQLGLKPATMWDAGTADGGLTYCNMAPAPRFVAFKYALLYIQYVHVKK